MKRLTKTFALLMILMVCCNLKSQIIFSKITAGANGVPLDTIYLCLGDTLKLSSWKDDCILKDNFNNSVLGNIWVSTVTPLWSNPCPPNNLPAENVVLWFGGSTYPRELKTISLDLSCYNTCFVEFDMKYGANQNSSNCESPDIPGAGLITDNGEGVHLLYSNNGGLTWTQFPGIDLAPSGTYDSIGYINGSGGYWSPVASNAATGPYYQWNHYKCEVPIDGLTANTKFKWFQNIVSGNYYDHWGIDNVKISTPTTNSLKWTAGNDTVSFSNLFNPAPIVISQEGVYKYFVTNIDTTNNTNCIEKDSIVVIVSTSETPIITYNDTVLMSNYTTGNSWYNQNGIIMLANQQYYTPTQNGDYYVIVTQNINCYSNPSNIISVNNIVKIDEFSFDKIKIYPVPAKDKIFVEINNFNELVDIEIIDLLGKSIYKDSFISSKIIDTKTFKSNLYFLKISFKDTILSKKIIIE